MNERQKALLNLLLERGEEFQAIDQLASELDCSEKTIRNDLTVLEERLASYHDVKLVRKQGMGVYLDVAKDGRSFLFQKLFMSAPQIEEERVIQMAYYLLSHHESMTLKQLAERYFTNQAMIKKDLQAITDWLEHFNLSLVSKQRVGSRIVGSELNKRNALAHLSELVSAAPEKHYVLDLFPDYEIKTLRHLLRELERNHELTFTEGGMESLLIHALIMVRRTRQHAPIEFDQEQQETEQSQSYIMTERFLSEVENKFQVRFPDSEKIYYTWHVISSVQKPHEQAKYDADTQEICQQLMEKVQRLTGYPFHKDEVLRDGLLVHLQAAVARLSYGFTIQNTLRSDIKKMYPYMFSMLVLGLEDVADTWGFYIPEDETAYLVLHFQASIERLEKQRDAKRRILIVCHMGVGMSRLLQAKIEQQYSRIEVLDCISQVEVVDYLAENDVDFVIATVPLENISLPYVVVSPLLESGDKARLNQFLQGLDGKGATASTEAFLKPLLDPACIFVNVNQHHRYEVVELMARELYNRGMVKQKFIHSALLRERSAATAIGGSIALPHARPEMVKQSVVAVAILDKPLEWGSELVSIVFLLAIKDGEQRLIRDVMQHISAISGDPAYVHSLRQAKTSEEVQAILSHSKRSS